MSASRAIRPLFEVGSRLAVADQFLTRSRATALGIIGPKSTSFTSFGKSSRPSTPICWSCRHGFAAQTRQLRFSSSESKPPKDDPTTRTPPSPSNDPNFKEIPIDTRESSSDPAPSEKQPETEKPPTQPFLKSFPDLPSALNERRSALNQSLSSFMDRAQTTLFSASQRINDLTGYSSIEGLKTQISTLESQLRDAQAHLTDTRNAYKSAVAERASTQREVTTLLARQKTWTPIDFERFTTLYRQDYELEAAVGERAAELEQAEREAERLGRELGAGILARYHEEQIWSDKIRRMSTWGTWGLMGVNILLFLLLQFGAEPWRRKRLVRGFEEKVREALAEERAAREEAQRVAAAAIASASTSAPLPVEEDAQEDAQSATVESELSEDEATAAPEAIIPSEPEPESESISPSPATTETTTETTRTVSDEEEPPTSSYIPLSKIVAWKELLTNPKLWRLGLADLVSDRMITLRMRDISLVVLEGLVTGAAIAGSLALFVFRR
ncbi:Mdm33 family-domain-containing protein [Xylariaceae sp. FL0594]|nr:Mdm33 family-domain-containing protein [Xylariaceae sp. FL0594]